MFSKKNIIIFGVGDRVLQVIKILIKKNINISAVVPRLNIRKSKKFIIDLKEISIQNNFEIYPTKCFRSWSWNWQ